MEKDFIDEFIPSKDTRAYLHSIPGNPRPGFIFRQNNHIAIDCGAVRRSGRLAAIRLDDGKEFYTGDCCLG